MLSSTDSDAQTRFDVRFTVLLPPVVGNRLQDIGPDDLGPVNLVAIGGGQERSGVATIAEDLGGSFEHGDATPFERCFNYIDLSFREGALKLVVYPPIIMVM